MKPCTFPAANRTSQAILLASSLCILAPAPLKAAPAATTSATNAPPNASTMVPFEFSFPKSVFVYDSATGRDPFFPSSARTLPAPPPVAAAQPTAVAKPGSEGTARPPTFTVDPYVDLSLKGITGDRRFALINGQPFAAGESYKLKTTNGVLTVKCVEIRPRSAVVLIDGQKTSKEIHLRPGL